VNFYFGHFIDTQDIIRIEIRLLNAASLNCYRSLQGRPQTVRNATLNLLPQDGWIHLLAAIKRTNYSVHSQRAFGD
jgi:hypothetical protein